MNFRIKLTLAALAAFILLNSAVSFATPGTTTKIVKLSTDSDTPYPPPSDPSDPNDDDSSGSSGGGCDHDSGGSSDNTNPDDPYDPNNAPMPN